MPDQSVIKGVNGNELMVRRTASSICLSVCLVVWLTGLAIGFAQLANYGSEPGERGEVALMMPVIDEIRLDADRPTLVMFIHPKCPCTRASLGELSELLARHGNEFHCYLVFVRPQSCSIEWVKSDLWRQAIGFSGVESLIDDGADIASRFGAKTSGETMLYLPNGSLVFRGGITFSRGHSGDNLGIAHIEDCLTGTPRRLLETPVFGCPLFSKAEEEQGKCCATLATQ